MSSISDYTIFSSVNPNALVPKERKPLPFPLENFDEEIGTTYEKVARILKKLEAAEQNPVNHTPARKRRLKSLKYKTKTCMQLIREISESTAEFWY